MAAAELAFFGINAKLAAKWVPALYKKLTKIQKKRQKELDEINDLMFGDPMQLANYYVEPNCQDMNPADSPEEEFLVSGSPVMTITDKFLQAKAPAPGRNQLFILSDAGMGKTALLTMLKLMHLTSFWPKKYACVLKKLGKKTIPEIKKLENKAGTILLLDSLDEDPVAYGKAEDRILEILDESKNFFKVIITCRTQFFPKTETDPFRRHGMLKIGGYVCPAKYLSFFDDDKVIEYCEKLFPKKWGLWTDNQKICEAGRVVRKMGMLRCRPMLLAYIEELMVSPVLKDSSEYQVYDVLVQSWLDREEIKMGIPAADIMDACVMLAAYMQIKQIRSISRDELDSLISVISEKLKTVTQIDIRGRALLNKNSEGDYRFSHYSVQEFCVAKLLTEGKPVFNPPEGRVMVTDFITRMLLQSGKTLKLPELADSNPFIKHFSIAPDITAEFAYIPPGTFIMGSPEDEPGRRDNEKQHQVTITKGFYMQTTQVTQGQWKAVMGNNPSYFQSGDDYPVENVSWNGVQEFIKKLNEKEGAAYRLPTEAEWEYAARAGTDTAYYFGNDSGQLGEYSENSDNKTHPVAQKKPNAWGLYDMHGNVLECCQDMYASYPSAAVTDPVNEKASYLVYRGGFWGSDAEGCRSACRYGSSPDDSGSHLGFRLSRGLHL